MTHTGPGRGVFVGVGFGGFLVELVRKQPPPLCSLKKRERKKKKTAKPTGTDIPFRLTSGTRQETAQQTGARTAGRTHARARAHPPLIV